MAFSTTTAPSDTSSSTSNVASLHLVGQEDSIAIDQELFQSFSVDSLMELAGLSVAEVALKTCPPSTHGRVLIAAGPGNNGGDGLVASRHLRHFGYSDVTIFYPKQNQKPLFQNLVQQNQALNVKFITDPEYNPPDLSDQFDVIIDAVFGFSFRGAPRAPYVNILQHMASSTIPVIAVDVPSGYVSSLYLVTV